MHVNGPKIWGAARVVGRLVTIHLVVGMLGAVGLAMLLAARPDVLGGDRVEVIGPKYDPQRLGIWLQERSLGRSSVRFMLGRSLVFENVDGQLAPVVPRPEEVGPGWMEDWSRKLPRMHAAGIMVSTDEVREHAFGWPRLCLKSSELSEIKALGGWREYTEGLAEFGDFSVPVMPLPSGLAYNTALLGCPGSGTAVILAFMGRVARRRAGLCVACAYHLDPELMTCPECGRAPGVEVEQSAPQRRAA